MNYTKEERKRKEREEITREETALNIQKKDFEELGIPIL